MKALHLIKAMWLSGVVALLSGLSAFSAQAEQFKALGDWEVHYIVLNSTFLQPDIAQQYEIVRSKYNAFVNISVLDRASKQAQDVVVTGEARDLLGNTKTLTFSQVREQESIYYLAQFPFDDNETYRFEIRVQHGNNTQTLRFQQKLVRD
ncbi:DUF4426 domain-containing protein [Alteromonas sp. a30]|uniref:DUF4426 domain-containing protein n=1 Tax=Alteromonas sp. a30 TaxID=2730917 RepID=UPI002282FEC8|nr:DUF4426 domain-containing protein [Alteromonas sp. a30]MCY7296128.1 DUF4426 domain-containing protein [Alteromonas sp. a30]